PAPRRFGTQFARASRKPPTTSKGGASLEAYPQTQLNAARGVGLNQLDGTELAWRRTVGRITQPRRLERVECFGPELGTEIFADPERLEQRKIELGGYARPHAAPLRIGSGHQREWLLNHPGRRLTGAGAVLPCAGVVVDGAGVEPAAVR